MSTESAAKIERPKVCINSNVCGCLSADNQSCGYEWDVSDRDLSAQHRLGERRLSVLYPSLTLRDSTANMS